MNPKKEYKWPAIQHEHTFMTLTARTYLYGEKIELTSRVSPRISDQTKADVFKWMDERLSQQVASKETVAA